MRKRFPGEELIESPFSNPYRCQAIPVRPLPQSVSQIKNLKQIHRNTFKPTEFCFRFKNKYNLKTHIESHTGEKNVQCNECGKTYSRKSCLLKHMEEHTGIYTKVFPCDFCDRTFRSLYNMQVRWMQVSQAIHSLRWIYSISRFYILYHRITEERIRARNHSGKLSDNLITFNHCLPKTFFFQIFQMRCMQARCYNKISTGSTFENNLTHEQIERIIGPTKSTYCLIWIKINSLGRKSFFRRYAIECKDWSHTWIIVKYTLDFGVLVYPKIMYSLSFLWKRGILIYIFSV